MVQGKHIRRNLRPKPVPRRSTSEVSLEAVAPDLGESANNSWTAPSYEALSQKDTFKLLPDSEPKEVLR